jgi:branched-chain amino acid aminotransferase
MDEFADGCAWVDGTFVPIGEARIPLLDAGFLRSDVTYDVVGVWHGRFFRLEDHLDRFQRSWTRLRMEPPLDRGGIRDVLHGCVARAGLDEAYVNMTLTRGLPRGKLRDPRTYENRFYAYAIPYVWISPPPQQEEGLHLVVARGTQRIPTGSVDPTVKNFHWGDLVRGWFEAFDRDAQNAVLPDGDGNVTEGPGFNLFVVTGRVLRTPDSGVLEGITRRTVIELAGDAGYEVRVEPVPVADLAGADELFITSTAGGVMPVTRFEGAAVGDGRPGPVTLELRDAYWAAHDDPRYTTPVSYPKTYVPGASPSTG